MASGKQHKEREKIIQLELFPYDLPAPDPEEPVLLVPPPKRARAKKAVVPPVPTDITAATEPVGPPASATLQPPAAPPVPAELPQKKEHEGEEVKDKFKRNQEARLAALRRARGMK